MHSQVDIEPYAEQPVLNRHLWYNLRAQIDSELTLFNVQGRVVRVRKVSTAW